MDEGDKRYLCISDKPEEYPTEILENQWDEILEEYDSLNGESIFISKIQDMNADLRELNELIIMKSCYSLLLLGKESAIDILRDECNVHVKGISVNSLKKVISAFKKLETKLNIRNANRKIFSKSKNYIQSVVSLSNILGRHIDPKVISTTEFIYLNKDAEQIVKARK